ncbi:hypothetical protein OPS25_00810 [Alteromonas ponticola]|uniref:Uncharacterized protein n=1 Tax=Alteromonas aquimaris TaxID=2998417 RepID=A0ABT3P2R4_9ALTE|nr:hypothetical protein [Alteromonas aquimaris]MCW8107042.1 hypothetical protein [Alteromonas aquimaris]
MSLQEIYQKRLEIYNEKQRLKVSTNSADQEKYRELHQQHKDLSEAEGLLIARETAKAEYPNGEIIQPDWGDRSKANNIDLIVRYVDETGTTKYVVIEAKGGNSGLGKRLTIGKTQYVQQGTQEYHTSLVTDMIAKEERLGLESLTPDMRNALHWLKNNNVQFRSISDARYDAHENLATVNDSYFGIKTPPPNGG